VIRPSRLPFHVLLVITLVVSQWAGLVHAVEHNEHNEHTHQHQPQSDILHDCLLFDGVATSVALPAWGHLGPAHTAQASLTLPHVGNPTRLALQAVHRVRARDPPRFS